MPTITSLEQLEALYGAPNDASTVKEVAKLTPEYRRYIAASPFALLATVGPEGVGCSPRGDRSGFVRIHDDQTLMLPDRRGNNRVDSLRNIVRDPRAALLFLVPGVGNTLRVQGRAQIVIDRELRESFAVDGHAPRSVIVLAISTVYFQCARALLRSELWNPARHVDPKSLPSAGDMLASCSAGQVGGTDYDRDWPARAQRTMW